MHLSPNTMKQRSKLSVIVALFLLRLLAQAQETVTLRSTQAVSFTEVVGVNPQGRPLGTFRMNNLVLSVDDLRFPEIYDVEVTRLNSHFPQARWTPSNSRGSIVFSRAVSGERCYLITPNNRPRSTFTYFGMVDYSACTDVVTVRGVRIRTGIRFIDGATFDFALQRDVAGSYTRVDISRTRFEDTEDANLVRA